MHCLSLPVYITHPYMHLFCYVCIYKTEDRYIDSGIDIESPMSEQEN